MTGCPIISWPKRFRKLLVSQFWICTTKKLFLTAAFVIICILFCFVILVNFLHTNLGFSVFFKYICSYRYGKVNLFAKLRIINDVKQWIYLSYLRYNLKVLLIWKWSSYIHFQIFLLYTCNTNFSKLHLKINSVQ